MELWQIESERSGVKGLGNRRIRHYANGNRAVEGEKSAAGAGFSVKSQRKVVGGWRLWPLTTFGEPGI